MRQDVFNALYLIPLHNKKKGAFQLYETRYTSFGELYAEILCCMCHKHENLKFNALGND